MILRTVFLAIFAIMSLSQAARAETTLNTLAAGGAGGWLNVTRPLTVSDLQGRVILLDFWTYGCVNCMQIVPDLDYLEQKFGDKLLVIGVHSAKFEGEKGNSRILSAARRFGLKHPVINDSDFAIWKSFGVNAWPTQIVLDPAGKEIARVAGEGHRKELESAIEKSIGAAIARNDNIQNVISTDTNAGGPLYFPARIKTDGTRVFIADSGHNRILVTDMNGTVQMTIGSGQEGHKDGSFVTASFNHPRGMLPVGDMLYIADTDNHRLRVADLKTGIVMTVAGTGARGYAPPVKAKPAITVALASPWDMESLPDGTIAVAMAGIHQLWRYDPKKKTVTVLAGTGGEAVDDGAALSATLAQPSAIRTAPDGTLYFLDAESSALRAVKDGNVKTLIGTGLFDFGLVDGAYPAARLQHPQGLSLHDGKIYIADTYNNAIRIFDPATGQLSTMTVPDLALTEPGDIAVVDGRFWIADTNNHRIVAVNPADGTHNVVTLTEQKQ